MDTDKDGYISLPEFKKYVKNKNLTHMAPMSTSIFYSLDKVGAMWHSIL